MNAADNQNSSDLVERLNDAIGAVVVSEATGSESVMLAAINRLLAVAREAADALIAAQNQVQLHESAQDAAPAMLNGVEAGPLDWSAPPRVWLQVDTDGDNEDRSEAMPPEAWDELTWHHSPIGGQEVEYVRKDLIRAAYNRDAAGVDDATFAEWLATEMPAGTVIGDPAWWANRIARQYRVRTTPAAAPAGEAVAVNRDSILRSARLRAACYAMVNLIEGPGCIRWADPTGFRLKDTEEWVKFYVATKNVQNNADTHPPAAEVREVDARAAKALLSARSHIGARRPDDEDDAAWWDELTELAAALSPPGREG